MYVVIGDGLLLIKFFLKCVGIINILIILCLKNNIFVFRKLFIIDIIWILLEELMCLISLWFVFELFWLIMIIGILWVILDLYGWG